MTSSSSSSRFLISVEIALLLAAGRRLRFATGRERADHEAHPADDQDQHGQRVPQRRLPEVDVEVRDDPDEDREEPERRQAAADERLAVAEQDADAEQHRDQRDAEAGAVALPEEAEPPVPSVDLDLVEQEITADDEHDDAEQERARPTRRTPDVLDVHLLPFTMRPVVALRKPPIRSA